MREDELKKLINQQKVQEQELERREHQLRIRELDLIEREINIMIHQQQLTSTTPTKPTLERRKGKFRKSRLKRLIKSGGVVISEPSGQLENILTRSFILTLFLCPVINSCWTVTYLALRA